MEPSVLKNRIEEAAARRLGMSVISEAGTLHAAVIPAKAGIHCARIVECAIYTLDSRFRGNDCGTWKASGRKRQGERRLSPL